MTAKQVRRGSRSRASRGTLLVAVAKRTRLSLPRWARPAARTGIQARGATAIGALPSARSPIGALAIGRLAIRRAAIEQLTASRARGSAASE